MANEITISTRLKAVKAFLNQDKQVTLVANMAGTTYSVVAQSIGFAAHEAVALGSDIGTAGYAFFRNLDATNYVQIGVEVAATFYPLIKLLPGEVAVCRLATKTLFAKADTAAVVLEHFILEA